MLKKKDIAILTFHDAVNYGAVLQTYALQKVLSQLGGNPEVIDYHCQRQAEAGTGSWYKRIIQCALRLARRWCMRSAEIERKRKFQAFVEQYLSVTEDAYDSIDKLCDLADYYDAYIVGSDQVWNPRITRGDSAYYLSFVQKDEKKYSYAASIGISHMGNEELENMLQYVGRFRAISVREKEAEELLKNKLDRDVQVHLDPTLLLNREQWLEIAEDEEDEDYILVYALQASQSLYQFASFLSEKKGLPLKVIALGMRRDLKAEYLKSVGPQEFLGLFANARYVVTNSFHGLAFSINMQVDFFVEMLSGAGKPNSRFVSMLSAFDLDDRVIKEGKCDGIDKHINYEYVNQQLAEKRENAIDYLRNIVK